MACIRKFALLMGVSGAAVLPQPAIAQTTTARPSAQPVTEGDPTVTGSDIIVTANKREERIQDVALAITAVTGADLNQRQLLDIQDLATRVPGLAFQRGANGSSQRLIIRGLNTGGAGATVASVVDDAPLSFSSANTSGADFAADFDPYDLNRIEVLKGPQGSLYGAAAEGGLIKYVTNAPDPTAVHAGFDIGALTLEHGDIGASAKGYVNLPIVSDKVAIRASGYYESTPGWISNNLSNERRTNSAHRYGGRVSLLLQPTEDLTVRATAFYQKLKADNFDTVEVNGYANPARPYDLLKGYNRDTYSPQSSSGKSQQYTLNLNYDLGGVTIQSISSYGTLGTNFAFDTPVYAQLFGGMYFGRLNTTLISNSISSLKKVNQEFRFSSDNDVAKTGHGLEWQGGLFYTRETGKYENNYKTTDITTDQPVTTPVSPATPQVFLATLDSHYTEYAAYADLTYHFSPAFDIEAGGRVFHNKQDYTQSTGGAIFAPPEFRTLGPFRSAETKGTFSVAPRYHFTPDAMIYARVATGYRPGGPNQTIPAASVATDTPGTFPSSFGSDSTINYEVGVKATLFNRMLSIDVDGFYINWNDIQVLTTVRRGFTGYTLTLNGGKATSKGFEWNVNLRPAKGLSFGLLGAYTDASLKQNIAAINGVQGIQLPYVPKWTTTATADYEFAAMDDFKAYVGASYSRIGQRLTNFSVTPALASLRIPAYSTVGAQIGLRNGRYGFQIYGKNLGDTRGITNYAPGQLLLAFGPPGYAIPGTVGLIRPREIGVRFTGAF